jgi:hypothetical protein
MSVIDDQDFGRFLPKLIGDSREVVLDNEEAVGSASKGFEKTRLTAPRLAHDKRVMLLSAEPRIIILSTDQFISDSWAL